jgi:hypothetical protein
MSPQRRRVEDLGERPGQIDGQESAKEGHLVMDGGPEGDCPGGVDVRGLGGVSSGQPRLYYKGL